MAGLVLFPSWAISKTLNGINMPRKNRGYKKGEPFRDARLFVIACEGEKREKEYFEALAREQRRVKVKLLPPSPQEKGKSAPKWVVSRAASYEEEYGLSPEDNMWLVMDVDRWGKETLLAVAKQCIEASWNVAFSNPCFEVWLYLHIEELPEDEEWDCKTCKQRLHQLVAGGYDKEHFVPLVSEAIDRAAAADNDPLHHLPPAMSTKVYKLAEEIRAWLE